MIKLKRKIEEINEKGVDEEYAKKVWVYKRDIANIKAKKKKQQQEKAKKLMSKTQEIKPDKLQGVHIDQTVINAT